MSTGILCTPRVRVNIWDEELEERGVQNGMPMALFQRGYRLYFGIDMLRDRTKALEYIRLASAKGDAEAAYFFVGAYTSGVNFPQNLEVAAKWNTVAIERGCPEAIHTGSDQIAENGEPERAYKILSKGAEMGSPRAMVAQAYYLAVGLGVEQDRKRAKKLLKKVLRMEVVPESTPLLLAFYRMIVVKSEAFSIDQKEYMQLLKRAARPGGSPFQFLYGMKLGDQQGRFAPEPMRYIKLSACRFYPAAMLMMGVGRMDSAKNDAELGTALPWLVGAFRHVAATEGVRADARQAVEEVATSLKLEESFDETVKAYNEAHINQSVFDECYGS